jgi:hypothetical protein
VNSKRRQIRIWELAIEYKIDPEEARKALAVGGLYRQSVDSLVPEADARRILGKPGGIPSSRERPARNRDQHSDALSEAAEMFGVDERRLKPRLDAATQPKQRPVQASTPPKRELTDWDREFIPPDEAIEWRDNGVFDARVAAKARQACLSPSDMKIKFDGVPVGQRLANGESIASVKARLREREAGTG